MRRIDGRIGWLLMVLALVLAFPTPAAAGPALTEIRPAMVFVGTNTEVLLIGSGFRPDCWVSVRASDIRERTTPAVSRSATEIAVLVGGDLTARTRTLEFRVGCEIETETVTRTVLSEWRALGVGRLVALTPGPPTQVLVTIPAAPSDVRFAFDIPVQIGWMDNSTNETGFHIYVDGRRLMTVVSTRAQVTGRGIRWEQAPLERVRDAVRLPRCGRDIVVGVSAYNAVGESDRATTTFRWSPCP